ncbi:uncharacterized protein LOC133408367 isoform X3 [Phycodurus eques]|uniref:uncharacterized protein LOC133408367 isoform X3 n=1 Tax=Phycodurus eques TaxID=693459 RepID=UPI002ACD4D5B|nr:uncharacterized protein LOC133408367 isoform X3 [Phycodurus eques]
MYFELRECKKIINRFRIALRCSDMSTVNQMQAFQSRLTERLTCFAMEIFQEVARMVKAYQEENDCLRSLLNNVITTQGNIAIMDHNRLARPATAVREQPPELKIPLVKGAEPCAKRPKMEHTNPLTNVTEEKETDVLQPFESTTKEEQTEVPVSSAVEVSEPLVGASMLEQTGLSESSAIEGYFPFPDTPRQHQREVSEPLANESNEQKIEYNKSLALEQESGADSGVTMDCPKSYPKEQDTTARQAVAFGDVFAAMEFDQPSTSGEIANQELLLQERPKVSPKKTWGWSRSPQNEPVISPAVIRSYNANMGGIDKSDMLVHLYHTPMKSERWYVRLFAYVIDVSITNSWVVNKWDYKALWVKGQPLKDF